MGGGQYIMTGKDSNLQNSVVMFSLPERVGALAQALKVFEVSLPNYLSAVSWNTLSTNF